MSASSQTKPRCLLYIAHQPIQLSLDILTFISSRQLPYKCVCHGSVSRGTRVISGYWCHKEIGLR